MSSQLPGERIQWQSQRGGLERIALDNVSSRIANEKQVAAQNKSRREDVGIAQNPEHSVVGVEYVGPRNVVQIFDKDQKQLYATILAVPNYRLDPPEKPIISFEERPSGSPEAIKAWFYPGDTYGAEFVYPHKRAVELAKRTNQNVLSMRDEMTNNMAAPNKSASDSSVRKSGPKIFTALAPLMPDRPSSTLS